MTTVSALPSPPTTGDPISFAQRADAFFAALPNFGTEVNLVASEINSLNNTASSSAAQAAASAASAASASGATIWSSGSYSQGTVRFDNVNFQTYRKQTTTNNNPNVRPGLNPTDWVLLTGSVDLDSKQDISNKIFLSPKEKRIILPNNSGSTITIDTNTGSVFTYTPHTTPLTTLNFIFTIPTADFVPTDTVITFILEINKGANTNIVSFPNNVKWSFGIAPTLTANGTDILGFYSYDRATTWRGSVIARNIL